MKSHNGQRFLCYRCFRPEKNCLCSHIRSFDPQMRFIFLMHPKEFKKVRVGTGRLAHLTLKNSQILSGVDFSDHPQVNRLLEDPGYYSCILYPGSKSIDVSKQDFSPETVAPRKLQVFVIDGTWPLARKMMKLSHNLHPLPFISFSTSERSEFAIKHQPNAQCLSTIESVFHLLNSWCLKGQLELGGDHGALLDILKTLVDFQVQCANDPYLAGYRKKPYKDRSLIPPAKKWGKRNLFFSNGTS